MLRKNSQSCPRRPSTKKSVAWGFLISGFVGLTITVTLLFAVLSSHITASELEGESRVIAERKLMASDPMSGMLGMLNMNLTNMIRPYLSYVNNLPGVPTLKSLGVDIASTLPIPIPPPVVLNIVSGPAMNGTAMIPMMSGLIDLMSGGATGRPNYNNVMAYINKPGGPKPESDYMDILTWVLPIAICVVISLMLCLCAPFVMIVFYCFRLVCNTCGGRKASKKGYKKKQIYLPLIFIGITFAILVSGTVIGYLGDNDFHWSFAVLLDTFGDLATQLLDFVFIVIGRVTDILDKDVPVAADNVLATTTSTVKNLKSHIKNAAEPYIDPLVSQLNGTQDIIDSLKGKVVQMNGTFSTLSGEVDAIKASLDLIGVDLNDIRTKNFSGSQYTVPGVPDTAAYSSQIPNINDMVNFDSILGLFDKIPNLRNISEEAYAAFDTQLAMLDSFSNMTDSLVEIKDKQMAQIPDVIGLVNSAKSKITTFVTAQEKVLGVDNAYNPAPGSYKEILLNVDVYRQLLFQASILLPWIAIILCLIPGLIFRKGFFFTCVGVYISLVIPLMHLMALIYNPMAIIIDDVCTVLGDRTSVFNIAKAQIPMDKTITQVMGIVDGCFAGSNLADLVTIDDFFNVTAMLAPIPDMAGGFLDPILAMVPSSMLSGSVNYDEQFALIEAQNFSSINWNQQFNETSVSFNITTPLLALRQAKADLTFDSFNFSVGEVDTALTSVNDISYPNLGIIYTLANISKLNGSDPMWIATGQQAAIQNAENKVRTALERNATAWDLLESVWATMDGIDAKMVNMRDVLIPQLESTITTLKSQLNTTSNSVPDFDLIIHQLKEKTDNILTNVTNIAESSKANVKSTIVSSVDTEMASITDKALNLRPIGNCAFLPNLWNGINNSFCTVMRGGLLSMWFGFIAIGISAIMFFCLSPFMSKRIKHLFRSSKVDDSSDLDDIELSDMPGSGFDDEKRMY